MRIDLRKSFNELFNEVDSNLGPLFIEVQKLLLKGRPLEVNVLTEIFNTTNENTLELMERFGALNTENEVVAFAGLSLAPTNHIFKVGEEKLFTWCAADAIIFPSMLDVLAEVESTDPVNGKSISVTIDREKIIEIRPESTYISWVENRDITNIRSSMCNRVHFFESQETAESWQRENLDAQVFPITNMISTTLDITCC